MTIEIFIDTLVRCGLPGVFLLALAEKLVPILPSYALLVLLGMTTVGDGGDLASTIGVSVAGSTAGSLGMYAIGRMLERDRIEALVRQYGGLLRIDTAAYTRLVEACRVQPFRIALIGQMIPVVRVYLALPAGAFDLAAKRFVLATALGATAWNASFLGLGYLFRQSPQQAERLGARLLALLIVIQLVVLATRIRSLRTLA